MSTNLDLAAIRERYARLRITDELYPDVLDDVDALLDTVDDLHAEIQHLRREDVIGVLKRKCDAMRRELADLRAANSWQADELLRLSGLNNDLYDSRADLRAEVAKIMHMVGNLPPQRVVELLSAALTGHGDPAPAHDDPIPISAQPDIPMPMQTVLHELAAERHRQDAEWGEQNHPDGTGPRVAIAGALAYAEDLAADARRDCKHATARGKVTWRHILREEVYEAFAEDDVSKLRHELVQSGAVVVAWIEAIDRRLAAQTMATLGAPAHDPNREDDQAHGPEWWAAAKAKLDGQAAPAYGVEAIAAERGITVAELLHGRTSHDEEL